MSNWATDFMSTQVVGNVNVALVFGLLQFATTFLLAVCTARYSNRPPRPAGAPSSRSVDEYRGTGVAR